jgi:hypothetical protein
VVNEALLCGLPVVIKAGFKGGGADYLSAENSRRFSSVADGARALLETLDAGPVRFDTGELAREISETYSVQQFERALAGLFETLGIPYQGQIDSEDLSRKLPAHRPGMLPQSLRQGPTWDVPSPRVMLLYLRSVLSDVELDGLELTASEANQLKLWSAYVQGRQRYDKLKSRARGVSRWLRR